jgi:ribonuclease HI
MVRKLYIDEALFMSERKFGVRICFWDSSGSFVQAHTKIFPFKVTTLEREATALQHALLLTTSNGFERVIFESDCEQVVNALKNNCMYDNELGNLLSSCRSLLQSNVSYNINFARRQANRVAHNFARSSLFQSSPLLIIIILPFISFILFLMKCNEFPLIQKKKG